MAPQQSNSIREGADAIQNAAAEAPDAAAVLSALGKPVFLLDAENSFLYANLAAEQFLGVSSAVLRTRSLAYFLPDDSPLCALIDQVRHAGYSVFEFDVTLESPRIGLHVVSAEVTPLPERPECVVVALEERTMARRMEHQQVHRNAARSITAVAAMLAHEVKNPLSGIRGAAQLLELSADDSERTLTRLICEETDRIVALVDRMETFSDNRPVERTAVNIHEVLGRVRKIVEHGAGQHVRFIEDYDPSLPPVYGNRDLLIQAILNLVKNAAEATAETANAEITLSTRYQQGVRLAVPGTASRVDLPLVASIKDNGPGIPESLQSHLFEPFIGNKAQGKGLGLALVAKIVDDHGGVIEFESEPRRTLFNLMLPKAE
ncbi:two-component system sensor histidine kinase NtrB [Aquibaculum arenosum]|uniref:histidine kinase n=1 Tax=Aquibaculum arenosum TaxID=3032591 RepID=A0ABT5YMX0_9PROT|nr:ATP-binding protein [Fodinicurvata sp. CAU 1616]MDF2096177.1 ATP-binding protein [Fodinicurvata sp. CAU 1616]